MRTIDESRPGPSTEGAAKSPTPLAECAWGIEIGETSLKAVKVGFDAPTGRVVALDVEVIESPNNPDRPGDGSESPTLEALRTFLEGDHLKGCRRGVAVPAQMGIITSFKLPPVPERRIPEVVRYEAIQKLPIPLAEVSWDYAPIIEEGGNPEGGSAQVEVMFAALKRDETAKVVRPFRDLGVELDLIQMKPISILNAFAFDENPGARGREKFLILDVGAEQSGLIITDGIRLWSREVPIGGSHFTRSLAERLRLPFAKAETVKRNAARSPDPRLIRSALGDVFRNLAEEVGRSINFQASIDRGAKVSRIVGIGNGFRVIGLAEFLEDDLGLGVERHAGFSRLSLDALTPEPSIPSRAGSLAAAYGAGLQALGLARYGMNLLPQELRPRRRWSFGFLGKFARGRDR